MRAAYRWGARTHAPYRPNLSVSCLYVSLPLPLPPSLAVFKDVPRAEWIHHIVFGGGIGISGLLRNSGSISSLASFFIMGLPGGIGVCVCVLYVCV